MRNKYQYTYKPESKSHNYIWVTVKILIWLAVMAWVLRGVVVGYQAIPQPAIAQEVVEEPKQMTVYVTQYSRADSCHNPVDGKCLMASGKEVYEGAVACPRDIPLGTKILLDDTEYVCEDRYARWLDDKREYPTIDVFVEENPRGKEIKQVTLLN